MSFFTIGGDAMSDAVRFWCRFLASSSRRTADDDMYSEAAQSLIKTQVHFEPGASVDTLVDLVAHHAGGAGRVQGEEVRGMLEREMLRWIAPKLAGIMEGEGNAEVFLKAIATAAKDGERLRRVVKSTFIEDGLHPALASTPPPTNVKEEMHDSELRSIPIVVDLLTSPVAARAVLPQQVQASTESQPTNSRTTPVSPTTATRIALPKLSLSRIQPPVASSQAATPIAEKPVVTPTPAQPRATEERTTATNGAQSTQSTAVSTPKATAPANAPQHDVISDVQLLTQEQEVCVREIISQTITAQASVASKPQPASTKPSAPPNGTSAANTPIHALPKRPPNPLSNATSPALTKTTFERRPDSLSSRLSNAGLPDHIGRSQQSEKHDRDVSRKRQHSPSSRSPGPPKRHTSFGYPDNYDSRNRGSPPRSDRSYNGQSSSLFVSPEPRPSNHDYKFGDSWAPRDEPSRNRKDEVPRGPRDEASRGSRDEVLRSPLISTRMPTNPAPKNTSLFSRISGRECPSWCLCQERRSDGTTPTVDATVQREYARADQPIADLMVAKLGFVFPQSGKQWSRNAIKHLQSRVQKMPCYKPVTLVRRGEYSTFNIDLYEDCELEQHLVLILASNKRTVANRRQAIESILLRFVSVNKELFPEFEQRRFPTVFVPA